MTTNQTDLNCKLEMPAELKQRWLEALRSGEYTQTKGYLCVTHQEADDYGSDKSNEDVGYCCLGVLATIIDGDVHKAGNEDGSLPTEAWYEANGLSSFYKQETPSLNYPYSGKLERNDCVLYNRNDGYIVYNKDENGKFAARKVESLTFMQIADYIEANVKAL